MRRRSRDLAAFSMSALDVLAMSTGVFVLLLVMLIPYYRKTQDAEARLAQLGTTIAATEAAAGEASARAAATGSEADELRRDAARAAAAAALEAQAARDRAVRPRAPKPAPVTPKPPTPQPVPALGTPVAGEMDLVFVIDRTASMTPVIGALAQDLTSIVRVLERLVPSLRIGVVAYSDRDTGQNPISILPLTPTDQGLPRILQFVQGLRASTVSSRTPDEDVYLGLQAAVSLPMRPTAIQSLVLIGDASAHPQEVAPALQLVRNFVAHAPAGGGKRSVSALFATTPGSVARGDIDRRFFQDIARAGNGVFTDHAGSMIESVIGSVLLE